MDFELSKELIVYKTNSGSQLVGDSRFVMRTFPDNSIDLIVTSPPFALLRKKTYGNEDQEEYVSWISGFGHEAYRILKPTGSFVLDLGGAYQKGRPVRSLYNFRVLIEFCDNLGYRLAQEFYWHNPAKLPSPIEWVNRRKIRVKDSVNTIWWFSKEDFPKANVRKVLVPYSKRMKKLLEDPESFYKPKERPSGHEISKSFANNIGGAIPPNLLQISNTDSNSFYLRFCNQLEIKSHPARFPEALPRFFIEFLTDPGDIVLDIFSGSNTTGYVAEGLQRNWISIEENFDYARLSALRFLEGWDIDQVRDVLENIGKDEIINIHEASPKDTQLELPFHE